MLQIIIFLFILSPHRLSVFSLYWNREIPIIDLILLLRIYVNSSCVLDKSMSIVSLFISYNPCSELFAVNIGCIFFLCIGTENGIIHFRLLLRIFANSLIGVWTLSPIITVRFSLVFLWVVCVFFVLGSRDSDFVISL